MAAGWARRLAAERSLDLDVASAGFLDAGVPASADALAVMRPVGVDLREHRSEPLTTSVAESADVIATMTRQHIVQLVDMAPGAWPRCFTLVDLVRRAEANPRPPGQDPVTWVSGLGTGRTPASVLNLSLADDIEDPMGGPRRGYERTRDRLRDLVTRLVDALA